MAKLIAVGGDGHSDEHHVEDEQTAASMMAFAHKYGTTWDEGVRAHSFAWNEKLNLHKYRLYRLRKNSDFAVDLKGRGFQPRRNCRKINDGFSR